MIDLTLDRLKRPAIKGSIYNFGTTVEVTNKNKGGLSTTEVDANMALAYELMREVNVSASDETSIVEYNAKLAFVGDEVITLKMLNGSFTGCTVKITNRGSQANRIEFNDNDALSVGPTQSYTLEWTGGNWWLGKEDADILKVTFTVNGDFTNQNIPCSVDVPLETLSEYARSGLPINAIVKEQQEGVVATYTSNSIASSTGSTPLGETTQVMLSGWFYSGDKQIFIRISTSSSGAFLQHREVEDTAIDNTHKYTFVVDSNDAVFQWAHNIKDDGQDYTNVLVKKGTWSSNFEYLDTIGTKVIVGEPGAQLDNGQIPIGYSQLPDSSEYYIQGIKSLSGFKTSLYQESENYFKQQGYNSAEEIPCDVNLSEVNDVSMFMYNSTIYILDGENYCYVDTKENKVKKVIPYNPLITINKKPDGSDTTVNESFNLLSPQQIRNERLQTNQLFYAC